jgi:hypothetical protein|tara:strand:- start:59 stop:727 length:669 start_codon:yes stop_codon:yes gene_type:complete
MKFKFLNKAIAGLMLSVLGFVNVANASLIVSGIQENVLYSDVTDVWDWDLLYRGDYSETVSFDTMFNGHQDYVMLGAINGDSREIALLAAISWEDFITHTALNTTNESNGALWYNNGGSLGFTELGTTINQSSGDFETTGSYRLSWHTHDFLNNQSADYSTSASLVSGGYRAGDVVGLNFSTVWDRVIFTANAPVDVPEPSTLAIFALGMIGLASRRFKKQS